MSTGLHAYRNIGFSFTESEATCAGWRKKFTGFDPGHAIDVLGLSGTDEYLYVQYQSQSYRLTLADGILEKCVDGVWTDQLFMNEALVVYHYIGDPSETPGRSGQWVPEHVLDPVSCRSGNRLDPLLQYFAGLFAGQLDRLNANCILAGGRLLDRAECKSADLGCEFIPLPQIPIRILFWDADEDFPAQVQILADSRATEYVHYEVLSFLAADIFVRIDRADHHA